MTGPLNWHEASRLLSAFGCYCYQPQALAMRGKVQVAWMGETVERPAPWEIIDCTESAIRRWLLIA